MKMKLLWCLLMIFCLDFVLSIDGATGGKENGAKNVKLSLAPRIRGGGYAAVREAPYMVSLERDNVNRCGGAIISSQYILTVAHCTDTPGSYRVMVGSNNLNGGGTYYQVEQMIRYSDQPDRKIGENDIALIRVSGNIQFDSNVQPIIYSRSTVFTGSKARLYGWGSESFGGPSPDFLKVIDYDLLSDEDCQNQNQLYYNEGQICALGNPGEGGCDGDSGGPLVLDNVLIGVISFVYPCGLGLPDVFTKVDYYANWIGQYVA